MTENALNILIVEDDFSYALEMEILIGKLGYQIVAIADNSAEALDIIYAEKPDLILMDIDIKGRLNGVEIGQKINHLEIPIIYITSFDNESYYKAAEQSNMVSYLVKPVNKFNLKSTINFAVENIRKDREIGEDQHIDSDFIKKDSFFFKKKEVYHKVGIQEIDYVEADDKYCFVHTNKGQKFMVRITLSQVEKQLPSNLFMKIHRSYLVMNEKISAVNFSMGTVSIGKKELPISRANRKVIQEMMNRF